MPQPPVTRANRSVSLEAGEISLDLELVKEEGGKREYRMKGAAHGERSIPGLPIALLLCSFAFRSTLAAPQPDVSGESGEPGETRAKGEVLVEGNASSTSKDWYGTEMDRDALEDMARQFSAGVSLTPRHNSWMEAVEWDEVIGMTMEGSVNASEVVNPSEPTEQGYLLAIKAKLFTEEDKAQALQRRLASNQPIGLSIGGWFTDLRVITNDEDEVERIIVLRMVLDHLAVTRSPANPDSTGLRLLRSLSQDAVQKAKVARTAPPTPAPSPSEGNRSENLDEPTPSDDTGSEGRAEAPTTPTTEEPTMTPEEIARIAAEAARAVLAEQARTAPAPSPAPAAQPVDWEARAKQAEAQNGDLQGRIRSMAGRSGSARRTMVPDHAYAPGKGEGSQLRSLVQLARDEGKGLAVAEVSERHEKVLGADRFDPTVSRADLESTLRSMITAGLQDGLIKDPTAESTWNG